MSIIIQGSKVTINVTDGTTKQEQEEIEVPAIKPVINKTSEEKIEELKVKQKETEETINFLMEDALSRE